MTRKPNRDSLPTRGEPTPEPWHSVGDVARSIVKQIIVDRALSGDLTKERAEQLIADLDLREACNVRGR